VIGYTDVESLFVIREVLIDNTVMDQFIANPHLYSPHSFNLNRQTQQAEINEVATTFRRIYFNGAQPSQANRFNWTQYMTDAHFTFGSDRTTRYHSERQTQPVYYYKFSIDAGLNMVKRLLLLSDYDGAVHADDIFYLFDVSSWPSEYFCK
jgi:bile salt-stimulated lipase